MTNDDLKLKEQFKSCYPHWFKELLSKIHPFASFTDLQSMPPPVLKVFVIRDNTLLFTSIMSHIQPTYQLGQQDGPYPFLFQHNTQVLVYAPVTCHVVLSGFLNEHLNLLQMVPNLTGNIITCIKSTNYITPLLIQLQWFRVLYQYITRFCSSLSNLSLWPVSSHILSRFLSTFLSCVLWFSD